MASDTTGKSTNQATPDREDRLKAALKANMAKRKAQAQARRSQVTHGHADSNGAADNNKSKG
ncbi:MAG: hypothetical protein AAF382_11595 [Pseudomonadota bacterium]